MPNRSEERRVGKECRSRTTEIYTLSLHDALPISVVGVYDKMHPEDRQKVFDFYEKVLAGEEKDFRSEMRILKPGATNEWNWVRMNVVVTKFEPEHGEVEIIGINYDITELKETEAMLIEAKEKAETMGSAEERFPGEYESRDTYTTQCDCRFLGPLGRYGRHGGTLRIHQDRKSVV